MKLAFLKKASWVLILVATISIAAGVMYAATSYRIESNQVIRIDEFSECRDVRNNSGSPLFIPTRISGEWSAFRNNVNPSVATLQNCPPLNYAWKYIGSSYLGETDWGTCSYMSSDGQEYVCDGWPNNSFNWPASVQATFGRCEASTLGEIVNVLQEGGPPVYDTQYQCQTI